MFQGRLARTAHRVGQPSRSSVKPGPSRPGTKRVTPRPNSARATGGRALATTSCRCGRRPAACRRTEPAIAESQRPGRSGGAPAGLCRSGEPRRRSTWRRRVGSGCVLFDLLEGPAPQSLLQLLAVQADRPHELVLRLPVPVADELPPAADGPVLSPRRLSAGDEGRRALPEDAVGRRPADALTVDLAVGQEQATAVDRGVVVEDPRRPALDRPAEAVRRGRLALEEYVRPGRQGSDREVVAAVLRPARWNRIIWPLVSTCGDDSRRPPRPAATTCSPARSPACSLPRR